MKTIVDIVLEKQIEKQKEINLINKTIKKINKTTIILAIATIINSITIILMNWR